jgi:uncharacterized repeat protein (TIGR01451 family)
MKPFSVRTISLTIGVSIFSLLGISAAHWLGQPTSNPLPFIAKVLTGNVTAFSPVTKKLPHPAPPPPPVSPTGDPGGFDIEGDLRANTPNANTSDWTPGVAGTGVGVLTAAGVPVDATKTFHSLDLFDSQNDNIFTGGSKVNDNPNTMWNWTLGKPTAKDDIHNGLLHLSTDANGHLWFVVGGDRLSNNGDSHINFEFLQNTLTRNANGTFTSAGPDGGRTVGDLLINIDLEMGGSAPSFDVMRWQAVGSGFDYVLITPAAGTAFVAANNGGTTPVSFGAFGAMTYAQNQFGEAAIDITALIASLNPCIGIKTVFIKTATSQSASAALKDFIDPIQLNIGTNPIAAAGDDQAACQANPEPTVFNLTGTATNGTPAWTVFSATGGATAMITNPNTTTPTVNVTGTGTVTLRLTVTSQSCGAATDDVVLTVNNQPMAKAGDDQTQCQVGASPTVFTLNGMVTAGSATSLWTIVPGGTATAVIADANAATTTVTVTGTGFVELQLRSQVSCGTATDVVRLTVNPSPVAAAGANQTKCQTLPGPTVFTLNGTATNGTAQWSILPGGTATANILSPTSATTNVEVTGTGTVMLRLVVTSQNCGTATSDVTLTVNPLPTAAVTGSATICAGSSAQIEAALTGTGPWDVTWSDGVTQMGVVASPTTRTVSPAATTIYTVTSVKDATGCTNPGTGSATVTVTDPPTTAAAGADQTLCLGSAATLAANTPSVGTGVWSIVSGPSTSLAQFSSTSSPTATFTPAGGAGIYLLQWTISNAPCTASSDTVQLAVSDPPTPAAAGPDQTLCTTTPANLAANSPAVGTGVWSIVSGPSTALSQFSSTSAPNAVFTPAGGAGVYTLRWTISNAPCTDATDDVVLTYATPPTAANAGPDQSLCPIGPVTLAANTPTVGTAQWSIVSGPSTALAQFSSTSAPNATFTPAGGAGTYRLRWTIANAPCDASFDEVDIVAGSSATVDAGSNQTVSACTTSINLVGTIGGTATSATWSGGAGTFTPNATTLTATYTPTAAEIAAGSVTLTLTTNDPPGSCDAARDQVTITFTPCADLSLDKKVDNTTPTLGQNVVFTLTLTNAGPSTATNVTVKDVPPAGLTFVSANPAASYSSATGIWTVGTLAPNTTATLQITAMVTQAGAIINTAEVTTSDQPDPDSTPDNHVPSEDDQSAVTLGAPGCPKSQSGSILVFPYYTSSIDSDTRLTISNLNSQTTAEQAYVHLFLMDGKSCSPADFFVCLTPNASFSFKASEYDPMMTGYVIAVAVNKDGVPIANNVLIGNAFVQNGLGVTDNYTAEKFFACSNPVVPLGSTMTELKFDGITYEEVPNSFAIEMQSPADAQQTLVTVGLNGDMTESAINGAAQVGVGQIYNGEERPFSSFSNWHLGGCQAINAINAVSPRVLTGVIGLIPTGDVGTIRLDVGSAVGLFFSANSSKGWNGIRGLHATRKTNTAKLKIPIIPPDC